MKPRSWGGWRTPERGVLARLRRLDRDLSVTWSAYSIDPHTCKVIEWDETGEPIEEPMFHLWLHRPMEGYLWVNAYPSFGHRQVLALERDVSRFYAPGEILRVIMSAQHERRQRELKAHRELHRDIVKANRRPIEKLLDGRVEMRDGKIFSGAGGSRGLRAPVPMDPREAGWERPEAPTGRN